MTTDLTCIITGHREDEICVPSLKSFWTAIDRARAGGLTVQPLLCLDRPGDRTRDLFEAHRQDAAPVAIFDFADQGQVRNAAIERATGTYTAFLDADDLWSSDWLVQAVEFLRMGPENRVAHPEFNYFFERQASIFCHVDQESSEFIPDLLRIGNYWDALCVCPTWIHRDFPFRHRDIAGGWAFEDWQWNCDTVAAGIVHKVVPDTILFKRRRQDSQTVKASANLSMIRPTPLNRYNHPFYGGSD